MAEARDDLPRGWRLVGGTFLLAILIHLLHEAAHMLVAMSYGVSGVMSTNTVRYTSEMSEAAVIASTAAGPALMVVFALAAALSRWRWAPSVLFIVFAQRAMAALFSALFHLNDEARLSALLGLPVGTLFAVTVGVTGLLFVLRYRRERLGWKWVALSYAGFSLALAIVVLGDGIVFRYRF